MGLHVARCARRRVMRREARVVEGHSSQGGALVGERIAGRDGISAAIETNTTTTRGPMRIRIMTASRNRVTASRLTVHVGEAR